MLTVFKQKGERKEGLPRMALTEKNASTKYREDDNGRRWGWTIIPNRNPASSPVIVNPLLCFSYLFSARIAEFLT